MKIISPDEFRTIDNDGTEIAKLVAPKIEIVNTGVPYIYYEFRAPAPGMLLGACFDFEVIDGGIYGVDPWYGLTGRYCLATSTLKLKSSRHTYSGSYNRVNNNATWPWPALDATMAAHHIRDHNVGSGVSRINNATWDGQYLHGDPAATAGGPIGGQAYTRAYAPLLMGKPYGAVTRDAGMSAQLTLNTVQYQDGFGTWYWEEVNVTTTFLFLPVRGMREVHQSLVLSTTNTV